MSLDNDKIIEYAERKREEQKNMLYVAGALFSIASQNQRKLEGELLKEEFDGIVFNPLTDSPANDKSKLPTAEEVFLNDIYPILTSDFILAELDGEDAGVMVELGIAYGLNYMITLIYGILEGYFENEFDCEDGATNSGEDYLVEALRSVLEIIPYKQIFSHYSDLRMGASSQYDVTPVGINHFLLGMLHNMKAPITNSPENSIKLLEQHQKIASSDTMEEDVGESKQQYQDILQKNAKLNGLKGESK